MAKMIVGTVEKFIPGLLRQIDETAEKARTSIITKGSGQAMAYDAKYKAAMNFLTGASDTTLWLEKEAEATGQTKEEVAQSIVAARKAWESIDPQIEAARIRAKKQVKSAPDRASAYAIVSDFKSEMAKIRPTG